MESSDVKKRFNLLVLVFILLLATSAEARDHDLISGEQLLATHDIVIEAISWRSYPITCTTGDTLSGEFRIVSNGDLFPGDETKYDNWLLDGVDFLILDEDNYNLWVDDSVASPIFAEYSLVKLTWSVEIPSDGIWYVVYSNDSIFMKQIEGSIIRSGINDIVFQLIGLIGVASLLTLILIYWKKK